jgi:hypothetical protein
LNTVMKIDRSSTVAVCYCPDFRSAYSHYPLLSNVINQLKKGGQIRVSFCRRKSTQAE